MASKKRVKPCSWKPNLERLEKLRLACSALLWGTIEPSARRNLQTQLTMIERAMTKLSGSEALAA